MDYIKNHLGRVHEYSEQLDTERIKHETCACLWTQEDLPGVPYASFSSMEGPHCMYIFGAIT